ncbi:MAG TPA: heparinase II/III family protein [Ilumatobacter sp.]|nr:heparinase II/III family protein [Ilumatobacter sp.]
MRFRVLLAFLIALSGAIVTRPPAVGASADGVCLPANGLMTINTADGLLRGTVRLPSSVTVQIGTGDVDWNQPSLDTQSALLFYSLKWLEELVRGYRRTGDQRYLARAVQISLDFAADNPPASGPRPAEAWYPMYAGQRATALACVASASGDTQVRSALASHAQWLAGQAGAIADWNQALPPYLGLLMAGCELDNADWLAQARDGFSRLITTMIDADGVLLEQAPGYGRFVWEQWGNVERQLEVCGQAPIPEIASRRAALLEWLAWMSAPDGTTTPIGDSFTTTEAPTPEGSPTVYTVSRGTAGEPPTGTQRVFRGGYVVGRNSWENFADSTYWTLRFGPGRDLHGHEDHTSVTFWVEGHEVLIDSGHSGYRDAGYREALRSAEAHNVLLLPDTPFRLRQPTQLVRSATGDGWRFDEVRDQPYAAPRTRGVLVLPDDGVMVVHDAATRSTPGPFDQLWHLPPGSRVLRSEPGSVVARHPSGNVDVHILQVPLPGQDVGSTSVVEGQTNPPLGWFSNADGHRTPAPVVRMTRTGTALKMITVITTTPVGEPVTATARPVDGGWIIDLATDLPRSIGVGVDGAMRLGAPPPQAIITPGARRCFPVTGNPGDAAIINLTPVLAQHPGHGQLLSSDVTDTPTASNVNYDTGTIDPNIAIAPIGTDGHVCYQNANLTSVHLVADHLGTIPTDAYQPATPNAAPQRVLDTRLG